MKMPKKMPKKISSGFHCNKSYKGDCKWSLPKVMTKCLKMPKFS